MQVRFLSRALILNYNIMKSKYKGVCGIKDKKDGSYRFSANLMRNNVRKSWFFDTEREAGIAYDKWLIEFGEEPVNILKRK